jgi:ribosomal-protein-alanine N-acetyltransferase
MNAFNVRLASKSDLPALSAIEDDSFAAPYPASLLERLLSYCPESFYVATDEAQKLVGYCVSSLNGEAAHLISIAVHPKFRGRGVATILLRETLKFLMTQNVVELFLEVNGKNTDAIALYSKLGFERTEIVKKYYSDGSDAVRMSLRVNVLSSKLAQGGD